MPQRGGTRTMISFRAKSEKGGEGRDFKEGGGEGPKDLPSLRRRARTACVGERKLGESLEGDIL